MTELELTTKATTAAIARWRSVRASTIATEVPILGRVADLALVIGGAVVTVEFKLRDWRRAVAQARDHQLGADFAWICMPDRPSWRRRIPSAFMAALLREGIGLALYGEGEDLRYLRPARSATTWQTARGRVVEFVAEHGVPAQEWG